MPPWWVSELSMKQLNWSAVEQLHSCVNFHTQEHTLGSFSCLVSNCILAYFFVVHSAHLLTLTVYVNILLFLLIRRWLHLASLTSFPLHHKDGDWWGWKVRWCTFLLFKCTSYYNLHTHSVWTQTQILSLIMEECSLRHSNVGFLERIVESLSVFGSFHISALWKDQMFWLGSLFLFILTRMTTGHKTSDDTMMFVAGYVPQPRTPPMWGPVASWQLIGRQWLVQPQTNP